MAAMSAGAGSSAQVSGTIRVTRTWVGSGPPPTKCYVKETANVGASAVGSIGGGPGGADDDGGGGGSTPVGTASASDGLGDAPTTGVGSETSSGSHLIQVDGSSGSITLSASINASADSAGQPVNCQAGGNSTPDNQGFSWDFDPRGLTLSASLGQTYHKDQSTGSRTPDVQSADGTLNLTTLNSYHDWNTADDGVDPPSNVDSPFINTITFTPNFSGWDYVEWEDPRTGTTSDVPNVVNPDTWSWSPNNSSDYWDTSICQMWYGSISYQDGVTQGQPTGSKTYAVSYTATDNADGAQATANANVQLHDQWENKVDDPANPPTPHDRYYNAYLPDGSMLWVNGPGTATWSFTITGTVGFSTAFTASFKLSDFLTLGGSFTPSFSISVGSSLGISSPAVDPGYHIYPYVQAHYVTKHYLVDHYTVAGFDTTTQQSADDPTSKAVAPGWSYPEQTINDYTVNF